MTDPAAVPRISDQFLRIAQAAEAKPGAEILMLLTTARQRCLEQAAHQPTATRALLEDLAHRLQVWSEVWPRLGKDAGFRQAVAREARLWSQKISSQTAQN